MHQVVRMRMHMPKLKSISAQAHKSVKKRLKELLEEAKAKKGEASEAKGEASADADAAAEAVAKVELGGE